MEEEDEVVMWLESYEEGKCLALHVSGDEPLSALEFLSCLVSYLEEFQDKPDAAFNGLNGPKRLLQ